MRPVDLLWLPAIAAYGAVVALVTTLVDLLASPVVLALRRAEPQLDEPPPSRNASVIVPNYDGEHFLRDLLPSLEATVRGTPGEHEILLVDNGSSDGSLEYTRAHHPGVRVVALPENRYFIRGNAAGVAEARGDILVFVNNDMRVEPDFLVHLLEHFDQDDVFAVTSRIEMAGHAVTMSRVLQHRGERRSDPEGYADLDPLRQVFGTDG